MEKKIVKFDKFEVKNWCVECGKEMSIDIDRFIRQGNFCLNCNSIFRKRAEQKASLEREKKKQEKLLCCQNH